MGYIHHITLPIEDSGRIEFLASQNYYGKEDTLLIITTPLGIRKKYTLFQNRSVFSLNSPEILSDEQNKEPEVLFTGVRAIDSLFPVKLGTTILITGRNGSGALSTLWTLLTTLQEKQLCVHKSP